MSLENVELSQVEFTEGSVDDIHPDWYGLVVLGTGGDWKEWIIGLVEHLRGAKLLEPKDHVVSVMRFTHKRMTNLVVMFNPDFDLNKLAMWRLYGRGGLNEFKLAFIEQNNIQVDDPSEPLHAFECMWVEDYLANDVQ